MIVPNYEQLMLMLDKGIVSKRASHEKFPFGFRGGHYIGAPGKDIFFVLPNLTERQIDIVAEKFSRLFPTKPPGNHVQWAACVRYVYGCFEKQGILRSDEDKKRMINEKQDWSLPIRFMEKTADFFNKNGNNYGLVIHYEMLAHRYGDKSVINKDVLLLDNMMYYYRKSHELARKIKSWKHIFTPYYWAGCYFYEMKQIDRSIECHRKNLRYMEKYCPDARDGYREKAKTSIKQLKKMMNKTDWEELYHWIRKCRNKCIKIIRGEIKQ